MGILSIQSVQHGLRNAVTFFAEKRKKTAIITTPVNAALNVREEIMNSKQLQIIYGLCAMVGIVSTMYFNILFMIEHSGFSLSTFVSENYVNNASGSISNDFLVILAVFLVWSFFEAKRISMPKWWVYIACTFGVALAFSFPLFLLMRERHLAKAENKCV